jgi:four helix bundle protein
MSTPVSKTSFENLEVYQLAERLADVIWDIVIKWDRFAKSSIGMQMVDAADSVSANIAEGCGRFNYRDNARFIRIARGSLYETKNWLRRAYRRKLLAESEIEKIKPIIDELMPRLNAYLSSIRKSAEKSN